MPRPGVASPHVPDAGAATPDYVQGPGVDLQAGTYVPPAAFLDCSQSPAGQGFTVIGDHTPGQPAGAVGGFRRAISAPEPADIHAILERGSRGLEGGGVAAVAMRDNLRWNASTAKLPDPGSTALLGFGPATAQGARVIAAAPPAQMSARSGCPWPCQASWLT